MEILNQTLKIIHITRPHTHKKNKIYILSSDNNYSQNHDMKWKAPIDYLDEKNEPNFQNYTYNETSYTQET